MCGIVYAKDFRGLDVVQRVTQKYKNQRSRGTQGFGFYLPETDTLYHNTSERPLLNRLRKIQATEMLFHHRWPTSTPNILKGCHPYSTRKNKKLFRHEYVLVHNGVVSNSWSLETDHLARGIKYVSKYKDSNDFSKFNDSEALLYDVALYLDGKQVALKANGSIAFVVIEKDAKGAPMKLHWAHNSSSPLMLSYHKGKSLTLASEGGGEAVPTDTLFTFNYKTGKISDKPLVMTSYAYTRANTKPYTQPHYQPLGFLPPPRPATDADSEVVSEAVLDEATEDALGYLETLDQEYPKDSPAKKLRRTERALERAQRDLMLAEDDEDVKDSEVNDWLERVQDAQATVNTLASAISVLQDEVADSAMEATQ